MHPERNTRQIKNAGYKTFSMLFGLFYGMLMDNISVGFILGLSIGTALDGSYA
jgi:hypothetical protein